MNATLATVKRFVAVLEHYGATIDKAANETDHADYLKALEAIKELEAAQKLADARYAQLAEMRYVLANLVAAANFPAFGETCHHRARGEKRQSAFNDAKELLARTPLMPYGAMIQSTNQCGVKIDG